MLIYMAIYLAMTLGTFCCILAMRRGRRRGREHLPISPGLARTNPALAFFLAMLLFSLAGIPPLAGFFAKYYVFLAAIKAGLFTLAVIGVLASVVGAYYYLMIIKTMYFDEPAKGFEPMPVELKAVLGVTGLFNLLLLRLSRPAGRKPRARRRNRCSDAADHRRAAGAGWSLTTRSARPTPRR